MQKLGRFQLPTSVYGIPLGRSSLPADRAATRPGERNVSAQTGVAGETGTSGWRNTRAEGDVTLATRRDLRPLATDHPARPPPPPNTRHPPGGGCPCRWGGGWCLAAAGPTMYL